MDSRLKEDAAVAATSALPLGTTIHALSSSGKNKGKEWLSRMGGNILGGAAGGFAGGALSKGHPIARIGGALLGGAAGEVGASRLVHSDKYDSKGRLRPGAKKE